MNDIQSYPKFYFAGFWRRFGAFFVDFVLLGIIQFGVMVLIAKLMHPSRGASGQTADIANTMAHIIMPLQILVGGLFCFYMICMHKTKGATLGKALCHIKVVRRDGKSLSYNDAIVRFAPFLLFFVLSSAIPVVFSNQPTAVSTGHGIAYSSSWGVQKTVTMHVQSDASNAQNYLTGAVFLWFVGSAIYLVCSRQRRAPHDLLAGTAVIKV